MSELSQGWKFWDQTANCWQHIDLDEFYGDEEAQETHENYKWSNLTIEQLMDSEHLKRTRTKTPSFSRLLPTPESAACSVATPEHQLRKIHSGDSISTKFDLRSLPTRLTNVKSNILDYQFALSKMKNCQDRSCERNWESSLRKSSVSVKESLMTTTRSPTQKSHTEKSYKSHTGLVHASNKKSSANIEKTTLGNNSRVMLQLVWKPRNKEISKETEVAENKPKVKSVSLSDSFHPTPPPAPMTNGIIHYPSPITATKRLLMKPRSTTLGYTVEPVTGRGVKNPAELESFPCEAIGPHVRRPDTPVEIKRLRLLPTPVVRKCMAEALRNGILEPEDTEIIMKRIKNKSAGPNSDTDEEIIISQSKRLISPLKYMRRPRQEGGPIYRLDESKTIHSAGKKINETEPITFKVLSKTESLVPTDLEIPFLQKNKRDRIRSKTWQSSLRSSPPRKKQTITFEVENSVEPNIVGVVARPIPPPPSPIKNLFSALPEFGKLS